MNETTPCACERCPLGDLIAEVNAQLDIAKQTSQLADKIVDTLRGAEPRGKTAKPELAPGGTIMVCLSEIAETIELLHSIQHQLNRI